jgi:hypothetical protein
VKDAAQPVAAQALRQRPAWAAWQQRQGQPGQRAGVLAQRQPCQPVAGLQGLAVAIPARQQPVAASAAVQA